VILICLAGIGRLQFQHDSPRRATGAEALPEAGSPKALPVLNRQDCPVITESDDELLHRATNAIVDSPEQVLAIARTLLSEDTADENGRVAMLVGALTVAGQFRTALELANEAPPSSRADWLNVTFTRWAQSQPQEAALALASVPDETAHAQAFHSLVSGWAAANPSTLADYAISLPAGEDRAYALGQAMDNWSLQDPAGMAAWLNTSPPGADYDQAIAKMIATTDGANRSPEVAMQWVENISEPNLKYDSLMRVLEEWNHADPAAAQDYAAQVAWLDGQRRVDILNRLQNPPSNIADGGNE